MKITNLPLVYSCSGCSSAAQSANTIALKMDREQIAEMSCIAGIGGDIKPLVKTAKSGRSIIAIDGCPLSCSKSCLARHDVKPDYYYVLSDFAIPKQKGKDPNPALIERAYGQIIELLQENT